MMGHMIWLMSLLTPHPGEIRIHRHNGLSHMHQLATVFQPD